MEPGEAMRTSGQSNERGLILIPIFVAVIAFLLFVGIDPPKTLWGIDQALKGFFSSILEFIRSLF